MNSSWSEFGNLVKNYAKYYKGTYCIGSGCPGGSEACQQMYSSYKAYVGNSHGVCIGNDARIDSVDGAVLYLDYASPGELNEGKISIAIDVNGINTKPNRWGHDLFAFQVQANGAVVPMGAPETSFVGYCSLSSTSGANGIGCAYKAVSDKDYFKNLP